MEEHINRMMSLLNEQQRRLFLGSEALAFGYGGVSMVSRISGVSRTTIALGIKELNDESKITDGRTGRKGGGRHSLAKKYGGDTICEYIRNIIDGKTQGDPMKPLSYTTGSLRTIAKKLLEEYKVTISYVTVAPLLETMGYSKQINQKALQLGEPHPDRNEQFEHINTTATEYLNLGEPVISVDTKKKENIGNFRNNGREYRPSGDPRKVLDHDFPIEELGKIAPQGIYNLNNNTGFVNVGTDHDTAEFAVHSISLWWNTVGKNTFPNATKLFITCDRSGSNGYRLKLWKYQLQRFANSTGLEIQVAHFPPGTSKWNKIEHRLFCFISRNWQGKPLIDIETAINPVGSTTTTRGLKVICQRDDSKYELAKKVSDEEFRAISLERISPFEEWNYKIIPR
ncbi:transposase [Bacilli bacterium]|nr:transposase [Bacilli bacterium]